MKAILIVLFALLACVVVIASCEHTIKTKLASKDSLVLESTNSNEDSIEFTFKSAEHFPMIGVKLVRQAPTSTNSSSSQQSSQSGSQSQQSGSQSSSQTTQPQPQASGTGQMQQEQANATVSTSQQQQQQQSNSSSQAASQQSSQSSNQTQTVEKQDNPSAQSSSQAGSQGTSSTSQATTPQSSSGQNSTASSSSTSQSSQQGSSSSSQSTAQTSPVSQDNSSISGDSNMDLTPNTTQSSGQGSGSSSTGSEPANNSTTINNNTTLINETLQNIGVSNSTSKDVNITDVIGRIISGENITEIINSTLGNLTQWLNSTIDDNDNDNQSSQQQSKRGSLRRRLLSLLESNEESEDYAQYLKFNKLKLLSSEGETVKEIPLSDANIHWNYGHSVVVNNDQAFKVPHVDVELPLSSTSNRPTLKIRTMMTEAPSHIERNGRDIQLNPRSMDIQITLNNLHDLLSEQEKKLSGAKWSIETEMTSTANSLHLMQTKNLNSVQRVVVMGNNFAPKGQFTFNSSPNMKIIQNADNDDLISIQIQDSSNSIQLNPIKFGVH